MLVTSFGLSFDNFLNEFGHSLFGEVDEFGIFTEFGGEQTFELLAESTSDFSISLTTTSTANVLSESSSSSITTITVEDSIIQQLLAESLSLFYLSFSQNLGQFESSSASNAVTNITTVSSLSILAENGSSFYLVLSPQLIGILDTLFTASGLSDYSLSIYTDNYMITEPITEEGLSVVDDLTEFGFNIINALTPNALVINGKYVFYTEHGSIAARASSTSFAGARLRYQHFQYPYIIIFDSNFNLVSVEDINTGKFIQVKDNNKFTLDIDV